MSVRIEYRADQQPPTNREILDALNRQHPDKVFTLGTGNTIVESYRTQPDIDLAPEHRRQRVSAEIGDRATTVASSEDLERMMTSNF